MTLRKTSLLSGTCFLAAAFALASPAAAQQTRQAPQDSSGSGQSPDASSDESYPEDYHNISPTIIVSARGVRDLDILAGTSVLQGLDLQRNLTGQLGDTLESLPGVSSSGFSPGASRPILRGFSGERVRTLIDGLGSFDVSNTSDDHAVAVEPLLIERIEVLRGPAVLLYGSQAIGGAVNVLDKRIPRAPLDEPFHLDVAGGYETVNDQYNVGGSLDVALAEGVVAHVDGSYRDGGNLEIPGYVVSDALRADLLADAAAEEAEGELGEAAELREIANQRGVLPNSFFETYSFGGGLSLFRGDSNFGVSAGYYDTTYGVPERPGAGHHHEGEEGGEEEGGEEEEGGVSIGLEQFRADYRGELALGDGFFETLVTRVGYSDYTHTEFEGTEVGTVFDTENIEARAELVQNSGGALRGSIGAQYLYRDFQAVGEEAFVAPNRTDQFAVFALQEYGTGPFQIEGAARYEKTNVESITLGVDRDFDAFSGALGVSYQIENGLRLGVNGSRVVRAPSGEELFANGPHIATQAFEVGDVDLALEKAWGVEAYVRGAVGPATINIAAFHNWFDNYIYLQATGEEEDDLPVFAYLQDDARYYGFEGEVAFPVARFNESLSLNADLRGEYVRAELDDDTNVPRIPPLGLSGALSLQGDRFDVRGEVEWYDDQNKVAPFETPTDGFTFVNASVAFRPLQGNDNVTLLAQVQNIFDVEGRRATSFTKDFVPLGGRNFRVSLRSSF